MNLTQKIALAAGALTLGASGIAAAAVADPPEAADAGLTRASENAGIDLPVSRAAHPGQVTDDDEGDVPELEDGAELEEAEESEEVEDEGTGPVDNHGAEVSAVARSDETQGREHGIAVSEVARQGHGKGPSGERSTGHGRP